MKRAVYLRERDERLLEERKIDAKEWLRQTIAEGLEKLRAEEVAPARGVRASRQARAAAKGCAKVLPSGTYCKDCGETH